MASTRRSVLALLALGGLGGCSLTPISWEASAPAEPEGQSDVDNARQVGADFFQQSSDQGVKSLDGGVASELRIATAHFDGTLIARQVSTRLDQSAALQLRERTAIAAPEGYELVAFVLRAGTPGFIETAEFSATCQLQIGAQVVPIAAPFGRWVVATRAFEIPYVMFVTAVPRGEPVLLQVRDAGEVVTVDMRTAQPADDEGWRLNAGFRTDLSTKVAPSEGVYELPVETVPLEASLPAQRAVFRLEVQPSSRYGLVPWNPEGGWAASGMQWLRIQLGARVDFLTTQQIAMELEIDIAKSFTFVTEAGQDIAPVLPLTVNSEAIRRGQRALDVTWQVPSDTAAGTLRVHPTGRFQVSYSDTPTGMVRASSAPAALEFQITLEPKQ